MRALAIRFVLALGASPKLTQRALDGIVKCNLVVYFRFLNIRDLNHGFFPIYCFGVRLKFREPKPLAIYRTEMKYIPG